MTINPDDLSPQPADRPGAQGTPKHKLPSYLGEDRSAKAISEALAKLPRTDGVMVGEDPLGDNTQRAWLALEALSYYGVQTGTYESESVFLTVSDFLNDLRHLLDFAGGADTTNGDGYGTTVEELAAHDNHYQAEIRGQL